MTLITSKVQSKLITLVAFILLFYIIKPSIAFKPNGSPRCYGLGYDTEGYKKTVFNVQNIIIMSTILIYIS